MDERSKPKLVGATFCKRPSTCALPTFQASWETDTDYAQAESSGFGNFDVKGHATIQVSHYERG